jgi:DNA helicase-2/ATP-dependent DNA helicase PcrA
MGAAALQIAEDTSVLAKLNPEQRIAAESTDRPTLVVSPAGTGKTAVLAARYLLMLEQGTPTNRILAITFSRRAAGEMRERIGPVLQGVDERDIFIDTFHAIGAQILRSMPTQFGLTDKFRVADVDETHQIMREACRRVDPDSLDIPHFAKQRIERLIELLDEIKNDGITPSAVVGQGGRFKNKTLPRMDLEILEEYESSMQADNCVDFNDLILKPLLAFEREPKMAKAWARQFDAVMVDEYQDTNKGQYRLLRFLTDGKDNVLLLGDDDQLIFAWRGADNTYVVDFEEQWPNGRVVSLTTNYRNAPEVLARAKSMIDRNNMRRPKVMNAARSRQAVIELRTFDTQTEEQEYIARLINKEIEAGKSPDQIAVLTRSRLEATSIALSLASAGIACFHPDNDILNFREVRALIAWARVALDENDRLALLLAMSTPDCGLTAAAIDMFGDMARTKNVPLIEMLREAMASGKAAAGGPLERFMKTLDEVKTIDLTNPRAFESLAQAVGLEQAASDASPAAYAALTSAYEIFKASFDEVGSVSGVLEAINISARSALEARQGQARVRVDTMHSTKGLEFDVVIVSAWEEGNFPRKVYSDASLEEDRRLAYVTLTRARDMFVATVSRQRPSGRRQPSRFLNEIGLNGDVVF